MTQQMTIPQAIAIAIQHHERGQLEQAESLYRQILAADPNQPQTLYLLGLICVNTKREQLAGELLSRSVSLYPQNPDGQALLGSILLSAGAVDQAIAHLRQAIAQAPERAEPYSNLGIALKQKGQLAEAVEALQTAIRLRPIFAEAYSNLGNVLKEMGREDDAMEAYRKAVEQRPDLPEARNHYGQSLHLKGQTTEAIAHFTQAIRLRPGFAEAHNNLGVSVLAMGQYAQARAEFEQAIQCRPDYPSAHHNLSVMLLLAGDYQRGWVENEWRWKVKELNLLEQNFSQPVWDGSDLNGRRIFLHSDQAFGDAIQFARYAPLVAQRGGKVVIAVQPALVELMKSLDGIEQVLTHGDPQPQFDVHCPMASLPRVLKTTLETIPNNVPYLRAETEKSARWKQRIGNASGLKIGLVWSGRTVPNPHRSMNLSELGPLAQIPDITFFSLQKGPGSEQAKHPPEGFNLVDWSDELSDFSDTAALIDNMDMVLSIDTAVAHLAGAMGKRTFVMLPFVPDWRWMLDRSDSPWYPTIKLFRQPGIGQWTPAVRAVVDELLQFRSAS